MQLKVLYMLKPDMSMLPWCEAGALIVKGLKQEMRSGSDAAGAVRWLSGLVGERSSQQQDAVRRRVLQQDHSKQFFGYFRGRVRDF